MPISSQVNSMNAEYARKKRRFREASTHASVEFHSARTGAYAHTRTHTHAHTRAHTYARTHLHTHSNPDSQACVQSYEHARRQISASENAKRRNAWELTLDAPALLLACASASERAHTCARYAKGLMICTELADTGTEATMPAAMATGNIATSMIWRWFHRLALA